MPPTHPRGYSHDLRPVGPITPAATPSLPGGPTLEEWVRAGYAAHSYPPSGYLAVDTVGWQHEQQRRAAVDGPVAVGTQIADEEAREIAAEQAVDLPPAPDPTPITGDFPPSGAPDLPIADPLPSDDGGNPDSNLI